MGKSRNKRSEISEKIREHAKVLRPVQGKVNVSEKEQSEQVEWGRRQAWEKEGTGNWEFSRPYSGVWLYSKCDGKPIEDFEKGIHIIVFMLLTDCWVWNIVYIFKKKLYIYNLYYR